MDSPVKAMLAKYQCKSTDDYRNALKEIVQEIALLGMYRAGFFSQAAFYGGTALRIFHGLDRFSEDLDFSLTEAQRDFDLESYLPAVRSELAAYGFEMEVEKKLKSQDSAVQSAFIKGGTKVHLLKIAALQPPVSGVHGDEQIKIKFEIDTDPPPGATFEVKYQLNPIPYSVRLYDLPSLFAGKLHALLCRNWKHRVKGRDYYDYLWYLSTGVRVNLEHLEARMRQSGHWENNNPLTTDTLRNLLYERFATADMAQVTNDVRPFIRDPRALDIWSANFFTAITKSATW